MVVRPKLLKKTTGLVTAPEGAPKAMNYAEPKVIHKLYPCDQAEPLLAEMHLEDCQRPYKILLLYIQSKSAVVQFVGKMALRLISLLFISDRTLHEDVSINFWT